MRKLLVVASTITFLIIIFSIATAQWEYSYYHIPPHRLDDCEAVDSTTFWASGANGYIIKSTDAGLTWSENYGPIGGDYDFYEIDFAGSQYGWAATGLFSPVKVVATSDFGDSWHLVNDALNISWIYDMEFADSLNGFISGNWIVLRTTDGGHTWASPDSFPLDVSLSDLELFNEDTVWACGYFGHDPYIPIVALSTNAGRTWHTHSVLGDTLNAYSRAIVFSDSHHGWVSVTPLTSYCSLLYATSNGGQSWRLIHTFDEGTTINEFNNFVVFDSLNILVAADVGGGGGMIKRSTDGGITWVNEFVGSMGLVKGFAMPDSTHGLVVGGPYNNSPLLLYYDPEADAIENNNLMLPSPLKIIDAYPNPFNSATTITLTGAEQADIGIYDITGRLIATLHTSGGQALWDAEGCSSGLYFARVNGNNASTIKLILLK